MSLLVGTALVYATFDMPAFGRADNPVQTHVAPRYIEESPKEIGVPNMVTSVLASYRGFDTFGEVTVIFTAGIGVLLILSQLRRRREDEADLTDGPDTDTNMDNDAAASASPAERVGSEHDLVPHVVAKLLIPFILLFALYGQFHGDFGPGGGFQAGVIFAAGFIL
ncbi:hydrogen gas-evolving membrane-bound hydrogenase subunit E, partial [Brevundimonas denitrificans]|uniref:hydrogen gas-evolving membrane-bound hydrogenase subunit E n=1 Tax=Brevundimonas denitrificans TaxID=1443434 RepID=UPI0024E14ABE